LCLERDKKRKNLDKKLTVATIQHLYDPLIHQNIFDGHSKFYERIQRSINQNDERNNSGSPCEIINYGSHGNDERFRILHTQQAQL